VEENGVCAVALDHETSEVIAAHHARSQGPTGSLATWALRAEEIRLALHALLSKGDFSRERVLGLSFGTTLGVDAALQARSAFIGLLDLDPPTERPSGEEETAPLFSGSSAHIARLNVRSRDLEGNGLDALYVLRARGAMGIVLNPGEHSNTHAVWTLLESRSRLGLPMCSVSEFSADADPTLRLHAAIGLVTALDEVFKAGELLGRSAQGMGLRAPLFIVRNDGGLIPWKALLHRPTLGFLSGPVAGLLGALHQGKIREGIIAQMGRSSTQIAMVRQGRPFDGEAELAHGRVPLRALELLSLAVGSESLVRFRRGMIAGVGPWSTTGLGIAPVREAPQEMLDGARVTGFAPASEHAEEVLLLVARDGRQYALTVGDAALCLGLSISDETSERRAAARKAFEGLAARLALAPEDVAELVLERATQALANAIQKVLHRHPQFPPPPLVGTGASAPLFLPLLSQRLRLPSLLLEHGEFMGAFGAALVDLQETIERQLAYPEEVERLRREAEHALLAYGAERSSLVTDVRWDPRTSQARLTVTGKVSPHPEQPSPHVTPDQRWALAARLMGVPEDRAELVAETEGFELYRGRAATRRFFKRRETSTVRACICDKEGKVTLALEEATILMTTVEEAAPILARFFEREPATARPMRRYLLAAMQLLDLSHAASLEQAQRWVERALCGLSRAEPVFLIEGHCRE